MFKKSIVMPLCLMVFQPCLGMENDRIQEPSTLKGFDHKQLKYTEETYKSRVKDINTKAAKLLDQTTDLGTIADSLTDEANRLANVARNTIGNIEIIEEAYKSAEQAYRKAAIAHKDARNAELASVKVELSAAKAEKELYELLVTPNTEIISDSDFSKNEHVIKTRHHMKLWQASIDNAEIEKYLSRTHLKESQVLRLERKSKVRSLQELIREENQVAPTNSESPLSTFGVIPIYGQIKEPEEDIGTNP